MFLQVPSNNICVPEVPLELCTVPAILRTVLNAASRLPLNLSSKAFSNKLSRATGVKAAAFGGLEVIFNVAMAIDSNLSSTMTHKVRMLLGPDPAGIMSLHSGMSDGGPQTSQTPCSTRSPNAYRSGKASASAVHWVATKQGNNTRFRIYKLDHKTVGFSLKTRRHTSIRKQHRTKNSPEPATNCAQITHKTHKQPHVELREVQFHIHNFILAF